MYIFARCKSVTVFSKYTYLILKMCIKAGSNNFPQILYETLIQL